MSESSKYPFHGVCHFENVAQLIENGRFPTISVDWMCGFHWFLSLGGHETNVIYPQLKTRPRRHTHKLSMSCYFSHLNHKKKKNSERIYQIYLDPGRCPIGNQKNVAVLLDENNGWLSDGALCIEYGFRIDAMQNGDGIWRFNFCDKFIDFDKRQDVITLEKQAPCQSPTQLYACKQLLKFHSPYFNDITKAVYEVRAMRNYKNVTELLQITHGVNINVSNLHQLLKVAEELEFRNVIRYCERQLIQENLRQPMKCLNKLRVASKFNLNHYLVHLLKEVGDTKQLVPILKKVRVEKMQSEFMKQCTKYFFENSKTYFQ